MEHWTIIHHKCFYEAHDNKGTKYMFVHNGIESIAILGSRDIKRKFSFTIQVLEVPFQVECKDNTCWAHMDQTIPNTRTCSYSLVSTVHTLKEHCGEIVS